MTKKSRKNKKKPTNKISSKKNKQMNHKKLRILHAFIEAVILDYDIIDTNRFDIIKIKMKPKAFLYFEHILTYVLSEIIELASQRTQKIIKIKNIVDSINNDPELRYILCEFNPPEDFRMRYHNNVFLKQFSDNKKYYGFFYKKTIDKIISEIAPEHKINDDAVYSYLIKLFTMLGNKIAYFTINMHKQNIKNIQINSEIIQKATKVVFYEPTLYFYKFVKIPVKL